MNRKSIIFLVSISIIGLLTIIISLGQMSYNELPNLIFWIILAGLCQSFLVLFMKEGSLSVAFAVIFASQLAHGTYFAVIVASASHLLYFNCPRKGVYEHIFNRPLYKTLFNISNYSISSFVAGKGFERMLYRLNTDAYSYLYILLCLLAYITFFLSLNSSILITLMASLKEESFGKLWKSNILWTIPNFYAIAPLGYFIYKVYQFPGGHIYVVLLLGPLLLARYSFQLYLNSRKQYYQIIKTLSAAMEAKDEYTEGHSKRVELYAEKIAQKMQLPSSKIESIKVAALLHDIGKIGVENLILRKPESLCEDEWEKVKEHPNIGIKILEDVEFPDNIKEVIQSHHERYDGTGYPNGLKGDEIPIEAYIIAIADAYDALTSNRPYRKAYSKEQAIDIIDKNKGSQFHPKVADIFISILKENRDDLL